MCSFIHSNTHTHTCTLTQLVYSFFPLFADSALWFISRFWSNVIARHLFSIDFLLFTPLAPACPLPSHFLSSVHLFSNCPWPFVRMRVCWPMFGWLLFVLFIFRNCWLLGLTFGYLLCIEHWLVTFGPLSLSLSLLSLSYLFWSFSLLHQMTNCRLYLSVCARAFVWCFQTFLMLTHFCRYL